MQKRSRTCFFINNPCLEKDFSPFFSALEAGLCPCKNVYQTIQQLLMIVELRRKRKEVKPLLLWEKIKCG